MGFGIGGGIVPSDEEIVHFPCFQAPGKPFQHKQVLSPAFQYIPADIQGQSLFHLVQFVFLLPGEDPQPLSVPELSPPEDLRPVLGIVSRFRRSAAPLGGAHHRGKAVKGHSRVPLFEGQQSIGPLGQHRRIQFMSPGRHQAPVNETVRGHHRSCRSPGFLVQPLGQLVRVPVLPVAGQELLRRGHHLDPCLPEAVHRIGQGHGTVVQGNEKDFLRCRRCTNTHQQHNKSTKTFTPAQVCTSFSNSSIWPPDPGSWLWSGAGPGIC